MTRWCNLNWKGPMTKTSRVRSIPSLLVVFGVLLAVIAACGGTAKAPEARSGGAAGPDTTGVAAAPAAAVEKPEAIVVPPPEPLPRPWAPAPVLKERAAPPPAAGAIGAVVVDEASNTVLFDKDAHLPLPPASLTKIATLIVALEHGNL